MAREILVSRREGISVFSSAGKLLRCAALEGAGALCAGGGRLFCAADEGRTIVRFDRQTLAQQAVFCGGPGIIQLMLSGAGERLYALCAEADSVLMLDAESGVPLVVCRVGCNPQEMALCGDVLTVAGGESGCVHLLDAHSLEARGCLPMPGPVYSAVMSGHTIHALCLTQTLDTLLVTEARAGGCRLALSGMPGRILPLADSLLASSNGRLYTASADGKQILRGSAAPGRASALMRCSDRILLCDMLSEQLFVLGADGIWKILCAGVKCASV